jgi:hypothetical protein
MAVVVLPTPPFWLAMARISASDIADKPNGDGPQMQTGRKVGVVEDAVEDRTLLGRSTWNARGFIRLRASHETATPEPNV